MANKLITGLISALAEAVTHEGAAAYDYSSREPLSHLVFTKGASLFSSTCYMTQADELLSYSRALVAAEEHEAGFAWKFAAYMRDPKKGKGNRIQGTIAPAILSAVFPDSPYCEEYVYKCLRHRADDLVQFLCHFTNLNLGDVPVPARRAMARAADEMDEYQLLKYSKRQFPLARLRNSGGRQKRASLRLVDALGVAKKYLSPEKLAIYEYLHAPTRKKDEYAAGLTLAPSRRRFFKTGELGLVEKGRLSLEQIMSARGTGSETWHELFEMDGLVPDIAFMRYVRCMYLRGVGREQMEKEAGRRRYAGLWPYQVYTAYRSCREGVVRRSLAGPRTCGGQLPVRYKSKPCPGAASVFDKILRNVMRFHMPPPLSLGFADISPSMFCATLGGEHGSAFAGDVSILFSSLMSRDLGYAATFGSRLQIIERFEEGDLEFAERIKRVGVGWGGTQVAGSVVELIAYLLSHPNVTRPRTLFFFSDMQFHPPEIEAALRAETLPDSIRHFFRFNMPPLASAIEAYRSCFGPVDIVLWNLAPNDNAPVSTAVPGVLMLSGFDANSFKHVTEWQESRRKQSASLWDRWLGVDGARARDLGANSERSSEENFVRGLEPAGEAASAKSEERGREQELDYIRAF